jgi:hypothetical protein
MDAKEKSCKVCVHSYNLDGVDVWICRRFPPNARDGGFPRIAPTSCCGELRVKKVIEN